MLVDCKIDDGGGQRDCKRYYCFKFELNHSLCCALNDLVKLVVQLMIIEMTKWNWELFENDENDETKSMICI